MMADILNSMRLLFFGIFLISTSLHAQQPAPEAGVPGATRDGPEAQQNNPNSLTPPFQMPVPPPSAAAGANPATSAAQPPQGQPANPAAPMARPGAVAAPPKLSIPDMAGILDPFEYDPRGRRDPFAHPTSDKPVAPGEVHGPLLGIQRMNIGDLKVLAILWDVREPRAILLDTKTKQKYTVQVNTKVGPNNGYVAAIREGEVVIVEFEDQGGRLVPVARLKTIGN